MPKSFRKQRPKVYEWFELALATIPKDVSPEWCDFLKDSWNSDWLKQFATDSEWQQLHDYARAPYDPQSWRQWQHDFLHVVGIQNALLSTEVIAEMRRALQPLEVPDTSCDLSNQLEATLHLKSLLATYKNCCKIIGENPYSSLVNALDEWTNQEIEWLETQCQIADQN